MSEELIKVLVFLAGLAQITLAFGSLAIPRILKWKHELAKVQGLIRQIFWTYAAYILTINLCFGLASVFLCSQLINCSPLASAVTGFIAVYWISRILIQFFYFDRSDFPVGPWNTLGEVTLVGLFFVLSIVYSLAFFHNVQAF